MMFSNERKYDVIVWGATGFTGRLVCEYLSSNYPLVKWAVAGRNESKLCAVLSTLNIQKDIIVASIANDASMDAMCTQTKVLISTAGPFAKLGTPVVASCVRAGTNYVDITGEGQWVRSTIDQFHDEAKRKQLKIIPCCGLDCLPSDLTCLLMSRQLKHLGCHEVRKVHLTVDSVKGGISGGTISSIYTMFDTMTTEELIETMNPYSLYPRALSAGGVSRDSHLQSPVLKPPSTSIHDSAADAMFPSFNPMFARAYAHIYKNSWGWGLTMPWVMQAINTRVVNRSIALAQQRSHVGTVPGGGGGGGAGGVADSTGDGEVSCDTCSLVYTESLQVPGTGNTGCTGTATAAATAASYPGPIRRLLALLIGLIASVTYCCIITPLFVLMLYVPVTRHLFKRVVLDQIQSGTGGPSREDMKKGYFNGVSYGVGMRVRDSETRRQGTDIQRYQAGEIEEVVVYGSVNIDGDAGYMKTAVMLTECALSLALDSKRLPSEMNSYGVITPAIGLGMVVVDRLHAKTVDGSESGIAFKVFSA